MSCLFPIYQIGRHPTVSQMLHLISIYPEESIWSDCLPKRETGGIYYFQSLYNHNRGNLCTPVFFGAPFLSRPSIRNGWNIKHSSLIFSSICSFSFAFHLFNLPHPHFITKRWSTSTAPSSWSAQTHQHESGKGRLLHLQAYRSCQ